jgi:hypothetical protein
MVTDGPIPGPQRALGEAPALGPMRRDSSAPHLRRWGAAVTGGTRPRRDGATG